jgi:hypothetical protein
MIFSSNASRFVLVLAAAFNTVTSAKESKVELLTAENYVILAKSGISTVPDSVITGDIAVSPIAGEAMTGFNFTADSSGEFSTAGQLIGRAYASDYTATTPVLLTTAVSAMEAAYTDAAGRVNPDAARINLAAGLLADLTLTPGVYTFGTDVEINLDIFFEGSGDGAGQGETDVFIIQISGNLIQAANKNVILTGGALAKNIFWQVAGYVEVGEGAHLEGILLVQTGVTFVTGSSLTGRVLAQTACDLQKGNITEPPIIEDRRAQEEVPARNLRLGAAH